MNFSGRSVAAANRVIEIDDVLEPMMRAGLEHRAQLGERLALELFVFGHRLDHQIAVGELLEVRRGLDLLERGLALFFGDALARHLPCHVAVDGGQPFLDAIVGHVVERDVEAGERTHVGNAGPHLSSADHPDLANIVRHVVPVPASLLAHL